MPVTLRGLVLATILAVAHAPAAPALACGPASDCLVEGGAYRIRLPARARAERFGAIVYFHGWRGDSGEAMADRALVETADRLGVALVAPQGIGGGWSLPASRRQQRDEFAFVAAMLEDMTRRFPIDGGRVLATGFSLGGSMVWHLACRMPGRFVGFAPVAGAFWVPQPERCEGPAPALLHLHGRADTTVPLTGRQVSSGARQADVRGSFAPFCPLAEGESERRALGDVMLACRSARCGGGEVELCLHENGHAFSAAWVEQAWRRVARGR
ncbi:MAG: hypothetical protein JNK46_17390 [Methylobacteriaceae bacterium]|nr:hypothetical protein [Methylobacteriaceae bacterium]